MSQENVEIMRRIWLAYVREDYQSSIAALDDAVELWSDPRANMETGLVRGQGGGRCLDRGVHSFVR